mmetsp:Transcript_39683/g.127980  ORF Transcript_39683/g.127980 Transcript_39683/m.127980 type:complete len:258 (-) Transcript_39683:176-949(-)
MISFGGTAGPSSSGGKNFGVELPSLDWQGLKRTCERLKSCLQGRGDVPAPGGPPPRPDYLSKKRLQMEEFIEALRHEIFYQYNAARADPQGYADTTPGLPPAAAARLRARQAVPPFAAISGELTGEAMKKVARLGYVEEEPDERLGEKPYLHCLGRGGRTDQMDEMRDVVANATAVIAELLLDEDKLPVAFDPFFTGLGIAIGPNRKHGTVTCIHLAEEWEDDDDVPDIFGVGMCRCCVSGKGIIKLEVEFVPCSVM